MSNWFKAHLRTAVPIAVGFVATFLVDWAAAKFGIVIDDKTAYAAVFAATAYLVYALGTWLERRHWAPARAIGRLLLSLGLNTGQPVYPPAREPGTVRPIPASDRRHQL